MATHDELSMEWSILCQNGSETWTDEDLQLAAELGKTLLERNKELETTLKQHQTVIDDQAQEIEYLSKQAGALREVNDSRLKIYEQLEISIQDLEKANLRLAQENASDKKHIKSLTSSLEALEQRCEELQGTVDELTLQLATMRRRALKSPVPALRTIVKHDYQQYDEECPISPDSSTPGAEKRKDDSKKQPDNPAKTEKPTPPIDHAMEESESDSTSEQITQLLQQLRESRTLLTREQRRVLELEEQLATMVQQNQSLEKQLVQLHLKDEEAKSMHEELTTLEEVRQGQLCSRCLRTIDSPKTGDNLSYLGDEAEDDDASMLEALMNHSQHRSSFSMDIQDHKTPPRAEPNLYRDLVEKYEALLEVQRNQSRAQKSVNSLSLQEEMQISGTFTKDTDEESGHGDSLQHEKQKKSFSHTPTDFSEAETSSSGFSDETSNKATQTEERPGSFLCTIADGEDCKFSIYDDASPIDSRFRNRPEYRELFSEIFTVLKKAAENKDEGEDLPLLDDHTPVKVPKVPPVTPATEDFPDFPDNLTDDTQSVLSSTMSEVSISQIESVTVVEEKPKMEEPVLTPYRRQPLEYLSVGVNVRKRSSSRRKKQFNERSNSPATPILGSPKVFYSSRPNSGRKKRDTKVPESAWNGNTLHFFSRAAPSPTPSQNSLKTKYEDLDYRPSTASQDLFKLKKLDLSYAEVLRNGDNKKRDREVPKQRRK